MQWHRQGRPHQATHKSFTNTTGDAQGDTAEWKEVARHQLPGPQHSCAATHCVLALLRQTNLSKPGSASAGTFVLCFCTSNAHRLRVYTPFPTTTATQSYSQACTQSCSLSTCLVTTTAMLVCIPPPGMPCPGLPPPPPPPPYFARCTQGEVWHVVHTPPTCYLCH